MEIQALAAPTVDVEAESTHAENDISKMELHPLSP
jgi:hypothetical protein